MKESKTIQFIRVALFGLMIASAVMTWKYGVKPWGIFYGLFCYFGGIFLGRISKEEELSGKLAGLRIYDRIANKHGGVWKMINKLKSYDKGYSHGDIVIHWESWGLMIGGKVVMIRDTRQEMIDVVKENIKGLKIYVHKEDGTVEKTFTT